MLSAVVPPERYPFDVSVVVVPIVDAPGVISAWTRIQLPSGPGSRAVMVTTPEDDDAVTGHLDLPLMLVTMFAAIVVGESPLLMVVSTNSSTHQKRWFPFDVALVAIVIVAEALAPVDDVTAT